MQAILSGLGNFCITLCNYLIEGLGAVVALVMQILPDSPFLFVMDSPVGQYAAQLNWILPISECIATLEMWLSAIIIYYSVQAVLRWAKAIE